MKTWTPRLCWHSFLQNIPCLTVEVILPSVQVVQIHGIQILNATEGSNAASSWHSANYIIVGQPDEVAAADLPLRRPVSRGVSLSLSLCVSFSL